MNIALIILVLILLVMISGGLWFYFKIFKKMAKEFKEFVVVTFEALKDRKITIVEKQKILKEWSDLHPYTKEIKEKFVGDVKNLGEEIEELYEKVKNRIKKK